MKLYLLATTSFFAHEGFDLFLRDRGLSWDKSAQITDGEAMVEAAGRVCYLSFGPRQFRRTNAEYIDNLVAKGHESVLEHATFTILVDGVSRSLSHQIVRHRIGFSYSQLSQQYYEEQDFHFIRPENLPVDSQGGSAWDKFMQASISAYKDVLNEIEVSSRTWQLENKERLRITRSMARSVLPNAVSTTIVVTGNARSFRSFLRIRGSTRGDIEMRKYCALLLETLSSSAPNLFNDFIVEEDEMGRFVIEKTKVDDPNS